MHMAVGGGVGPHCQWKDYYPIVGVSGRNGAPSLEE